MNLLILFMPGNELTLSTYRGEPHVFGSTFYVLTGTHGTHAAIGVFCYWAG